ALRVRQELDEPMAERVNDSLDVRVRERGVALELCQEAGEDAAVERVCEEPGELPDPHEQQRPYLLAVRKLELGGQVAEGVGQQVLLARPAAVDRVAPDTRARSDCIDRGCRKASFGDQLERGADDRLPHTGLTGASAAARRQRAGVVCAHLYGTYQFRNRWISGNVRSRKDRKEPRCSTSTSPLRLVPRSRLP